MIELPKAMPAPKIDRLSISSWQKGYVSSFDAGRMPNSGLLRATNAQLRQNGTIGPRDGTMQYGEAAPGVILGFEEFVVIEANKRVNKKLAIVKTIAGNAEAYIAKDGVGWQKVAGGVVFDGSAHPTFTQVRDQVVITNGVDYTTFYNIKENKIFRPQALSNVTGVKATAHGLAGGSETLYYCITAIKGGETARSDAATVKVSKSRAEWRGLTVKEGESKEYVKVTWNKVTGAEYYIIYAGISPSSMRLMHTVAHEQDGGSTQSYDDSGRMVLNPNVIPPNTNGTIGVRAARSQLVAGRLYLLGDADDPWKITFGGAEPDTMLDFSALAGGYIRINAGSKEIPVAMQSFRNGRGDAVPMILCSETNGNGSLKYLQTSNMQLDSTNLQWISVIDDNGRDGTDSPDAVVVYNNALIYPSRTGFKTTLTKPQMQNVLSTDSLTDDIMPDIKLLNNNVIHKALGLEVSGTIYFAMPVGSSELNQVWVLDMKRGGVWCMPWLIGNVNDVKVYGSSDGKSRVLFAIENRLMELTPAAIHSDDGRPFLTDVNSGVVKFSKDGAMWASVVDITFILLRPTGTVQFAVSGKTEYEPLQPLVDFKKNFTPQFVPTGWSDWSGWSSPLGWGFVPLKHEQVSGEVRVTITKSIDEDVNWLQYSITSGSSGTSFELSDVIIQYIPIGVIFEEDDEEFDSEL